MKTKITFLLLAVATLFVTACSEDDVNRDPSPLANPNSSNVYFLESNNSSVIIPIDASEVEVFIARKKADAAQDVKLLLEDSYEGSLFTIPSSVSFGAGEDTVSFKISIGNVELMRDYHIAISVDFEQTNPYDNQSLYSRIEMNIKKEDFAPYAEGTYTCDFFEDSWAQILEYSPSTETYRFKGLWFPNYDVTFKWEGENVTMLGNVSGDFVVIPTGYFHSTYGAVSAYFGACTYNAATKTFDFPINWRVSAGSFGDYPGKYVISKEL